MFHIIGFGQNKPPGSSQQFFIN